MINAIQSAPVEPGMGIPHILLVAPPPIRTPKGSIAPKFEGAEVRSLGLAQAYKAVSEKLDCTFFDAATVVESSAIDGVHLDAAQHLQLGRALADVAAARLTC